MKRLILFILIVFLVSSCVDDTSLSSGKPDTEYSKEEAKVFFEDYVTSIGSVVSRSYNNHSILQVDITPQWESSVLSGENSLFSVDVPIYENRMLMAQPGKNTLLVYALQKVVVVKDAQTNTQGAYLLTLVPDLEYSHKPLNPDVFMNTGGKGSYSGMAIYSLPLTNTVVRVDCYKNGVKTKGYGLFGTEEENKLAWDNINNILQELTFYVRENIRTRTILEGGMLPPVNVIVRQCPWCHSYSCPGWCGGSGGGGGGGGGSSSGGGGGGTGGSSPDPNPGSGTNPPDENKDPHAVENQKLTGFMLDFFSKIDQTIAKTLIDFLAKSNTKMGVGDLGDYTVPNVFWTTVDGKIVPYIIFPPAFVSKATDAGMNNAFCHEMWHIYKNMGIGSLKDINEIGDHSSMLTDPIYDSWLRAIFPGENNNYYEVLKYAGAENAPEYNNLSPETKKAIKNWRNANGLGE